jgi:hypothetical protein
VGWVARLGAPVFSIMQETRAGFDQRFELGYFA